MDTDPNDYGRELRRLPRISADGDYFISWLDDAGNQQTARASRVDVAETGVCLNAGGPVSPGISVSLEQQGGGILRDGIVRYCVPKDGCYQLGIEFIQQPGAQPAVAGEETDYYEFLQISSKAEPATIHRIYRFMAGRFHPDNPETGDPEKFLLLNRAYQVLSNPESRSRYDHSRKRGEGEPYRIFEQKAFVNGIEGEGNRRLGVLALLYIKRRSTPDDPSVSLLDLEKWMGFPREYLGFTVWYLKSKQYITVADNSDFTLTASGVDFVEENAQRNEVLASVLNETGHSAMDPTPADNPFRTDRTGGVFKLGPAVQPNLSAAVPENPEQPEAV